MSRIAKQPITIPDGISVAIADAIVTVRGPKGELYFKVHPDVGVDNVDGKIQVVVKQKSDVVFAIAGVTRTTIANHIYGVSQGWQKTLELVGVGYRAVVTGNELVLTIGFSHPVKIPMPKGITFEVKDNKIIVSGADKQAVGEIAAEIRSLRPPEPYKGKGIRYMGEIIRKKAGKAAKAVGAAAGGK